MGFYGFLWVLNGFHMGLGDPVWVHMGLLGARAVAAGLRTFFCPASFGLPDLAARPGCGGKTAPPPGGLHSPELIVSIERYQTP